MRNRFSNRETLCIQVGGSGSADYNINVGKTSATGEVNAASGANAVNDIKAILGNTLASLSPKGYGLTNEAANFAKIG